MIIKLKMTDISTLSTWRSEVLCAGRLSTESCEYLDKYKPLGRLSNTCIFWPFAPLAVICPFELVPLNVKKLIMAMPLERSKCSNMDTFRISNKALLNVTIIGSKEEKSGVGPK